MDAMVLAAAAKALGRQLSDPVDLGGSSRSSVLRCRVDDDDAGVVVKAYKDTPGALAGFAAEAAGLAMCEKGPRLLAVDSSVPLVVMSDLGDAPSMADALLGSSEASARNALAMWARTYGEIAVGAAGRQQEFDGLRAEYSRGHGGASVFEQFADVAEWLPDVPGGMREEMELLAESAERYPVFSPGDICPDNNLMTRAGFRVLDFEGAGFHSAFLDAAYVRMPFATCWCVFRLPGDVSKELEAIYRAEVVRIHPELADDRVWEEGVRHAVATWTIRMTAILLSGAQKGDRPTHRTRRPVPTIRQMLRYRWAYLRNELGDELPVLGTVMEGLLRESVEWNVEALPAYPAFASGSTAP
jgi:hypothetical protein